jgi:hypothetical protein
MVVLPQGRASANLENGALWLVLYTMLQQADNSHAVSQSFTTSLRLWSVSTQPGAVQTMAAVAALACCLVRHGAAWLCRRQQSISEVAPALHGGCSCCATGHANHNPVDNPRLLAVGRGPFKGGSIAGMVCNLYGTLASHVGPGLHLTSKVLCA